MIRKITKLLPSSFFKDERFLPKLATASVISELYDEHNILTFYGSNTDIPLIISPPLVVKEKEIDYFISSLDQVLQKGLLRLIAKFAKRMLPVVRKKEMERIRQARKSSAGKRESVEIDTSYIEYIAELRKTPQDKDLSLIHISEPTRPY